MGDIVAARSLRFPVSGPVPVRAVGHGPPAGGPARHEKRRGERDDEESDGHHRQEVEDAEQPNERPCNSPCSWATVRSAPDENGRDAERDDERQADRKKGGRTVLLDERLRGGGDGPGRRVRRLPRRRARLLPRPRAQRPTSPPPRARAPSGGPAGSSIWVPGRRRLRWPSPCSVPADVAARLKAASPMLVEAGCRRGVHRRVPVELHRIAHRRVGSGFAGHDRSLPKVRRGEHR